MKNPLWKIRSGEFAGWKDIDSNRLYNASGTNIGYFSGDIAYSLNGRYIGQMYNDSRIGVKTGIIHPIKASYVAYVGIALAPYVNKVGVSVAGWEDPDF